jgi:hypothetical protein
MEREAEGDRTFEGEGRAVKKPKERPWQKMKKLEVRQGARSGWWEMRVTKKDGTVVTMIGKKVAEFYSETESREVLSEGELVG